MERPSLLSALDDSVTAGVSEADVVLSVSEGAVVDSVATVVSVDVVSFGVWQAARPRTIEPVRNKQINLFITYPSPNRNVSEHRLLTNILACLLLGVCSFVDTGAVLLI